MISDVIADTISEITRYQTALPHVYAEDAEMLAALLTHLETVRRHYDTTPEQEDRDIIASIAAKHHIDGDWLADKWRA
jgi:hypothetical protein